MSRGKAIVLAIFTVWPLLYIAIFLCTMFAMVISDVVHQGRASEPPALFAIIFVLHFFTMLESFVLLAIYIYHLFKTDRVPTDKKALWAVVLFLGNMFSMPVYWYFYIWRQDTTKKADAPEKEH